MAKVHSAKTKTYYMIGVTCKDKTLLYQGPHSDGEPNFLPYGWTNLGKTFSRRGFAEAKAAGLTEYFKLKFGKKNSLKCKVYKIKVDLEEA